MKWLSAQSLVVAVAAAIIGAAVALLFRIPADAQPADYLSLYGSLMGSALAVLAAALVIFLQFGEQDARRRRTLQILIDEIQRNSNALDFFRQRIGEPGRSDEFQFTARRARDNFEVAAAVANALQIEGPNFARVALVFRHHNRVLKILKEIGEGAADDDWRISSAPAILNVACAQASKALSEKL